MAVSFDGDTLTITLESGVTEVDVINDLYEPWKDWMLSSPTNRRFPQAFRSDGGAPLSSIINQGSYIFLNNSEGWRIKPPEEDITIYLTGNLVPLDTALPSFAPTTGDFTVAILGLQPITQGVTPVMAEQLAFASYGGVISIDPLNVSGYAISGTDFPAGTLEYPCLDPIDAHEIAEAIGIHHLRFLSDATLGAGFAAPGDVLDSSNKMAVTLTLDPGSVLDNCKFHDITITGTLDANSFVHQCIIRDLDYVEGDLHECEVEGYLNVIGAAGLELFNCYSGRKGAAEPAIIDMQGGGKNVAVHNWSGHLQIQNMTAYGIVGVSTSGAMHVKVESSVSAGMVHIMGCAKIQDNSTGTASVRTSYLLTPASIAQAVMEQTVHGTITVQQALSQLHDHGFGKWDYNDTTKVFTLYENDGLTVLAQFNMAQSGAPINPFITRTPV